MLRSYCTIAIRHLTRQLGYTILNTAGLSFGLTCFLLIALYVVDELRFDTFHTYANQLYRVVETKTSSAAKETKVANVAFNVGAGAAAQLPEVVNTTVLFHQGRANIADEQNQHVFYAGFQVAPQSFLDMFDFPLLAGNRATALSAPYTVILTQKMALSIFGTHQVLGKNLRVDRYKTPFRITGVVKDVPTYSHLQFDLLFSQATLASDEDFKRLRNEDWHSNAFLTYIQLQPGASAEAVSRKLEKAVDQHREPAQAAASSFFLQPITDIHLKSAGIEGAQGGDIAYIYLFSAVALLVLGIASINYMNMATARAAGRAKEIGVRKVAGAGSGNLVSQFLVESLLIAFLSLVFAVVAVNIALPSFNAFTGKALTLGFSTDAFIWLGVLAATLGVGVVSGSYPAFYLSRFEPFLVLKKESYFPRGGLSIRRALVIVQFALSIMMIAATLVVYRQMQYVQSKNLGFAQQQLLVVDINSGLVRRGFQTIKNEYAKLPGVEQVTVSSRVPGDWKGVPQVGIGATGQLAGQEIKSYFIGADPHFLSTYRIKLRKGRNFNDSPADSVSVIVNQTAAKSLGIREPSNQWLEIKSFSYGGDGSSLEKPLKVRVIGIADDFHFQSLHETIAPMVLGYWKNPLHNIDYFTVRVGGTNLPQTLSAMEEVLRKIDPDHLFEYHFLDQQWALFYQEDGRRERIFAAAALSAILIACMGIFGLAAYTAQLRTKEIGVRKVLGASVANITLLLSKEFLKLVVLANLLAWPVAWYASSQWLEGFAYRVGLGWGVFVLAGGAALLIALATVGYQAVKAALANPVRSLRNE